ncbi:phage protease [Dietzia cinnamea]|uniref:phage protease n=1 Tax=Dietzia cinnamea TaxID=321318 RepID=UPI00223B7185|nr:phage protease [Dietzia cinnamea]MCT2077503.1 phage protease [Dietzia cinnamea]MCT2219812.1 phage protease [Dietzia cinnamea]
MKTKPILFSKQLKASAGKGNYPSRIEAIQVGEWCAPYHGDFEVTRGDLLEAKANFDAGIYRVNGTEPLAGTLDHLGGGTPAAFRMTAIEVEGDSLYVSVEWTELGKEKLDRDEYRYFSIEYYPRSMPWTNPEDAGQVLPNVITGGTLTNDPLFKKLKPVMASARAGESDNHNERKGMDLETIRAKEVADLTAEEKQFLAEHKADLTEDELTKFELAEGGDQGQGEGQDQGNDAGDQGQAGVEASAAGRIAALEAKLAAVQASATAATAALAERDAREFVQASVKLGRIKSDQEDAAVQLLTASSKSQAAAVKKFIEGLPENAELKASALGTDSQAGAPSAINAVYAKADELVKADAGLTKAEAIMQVLKADKDLATKFEAERNQ